MIGTDVNYIRENLDLFFVFSMVAAQMDPNNQKKSVLAMEVEPVTINNPIIWKLSDQGLDATLGTRPTRYIVTRRRGTSQIDQSF